LMLFTYGALKRETLSDNFSPNKMRERITAASDKIRTAALQPDELPKDPVLNVNKEAVKSGDYVEQLVINRKLTDDVPMRDDPQIFPVEELRAGSGRGIYSAAAAVRAEPRRGPGGAQRAPVNAAKGRFWAVVTGLLPVKKQEDAYQLALADADLNAKQKDDSKPQYLDVFDVQRAEVTGESTENLQWTSLRNLRQIIAQSRAEGGKGSDIVDEKYIDSNFTMPLPPLDVEWDESIAHLPQIPLRSSARQLRNAEAVEPDAEMPQKAADDGGSGVFGGPDPEPEPEAPVDSDAEKSPGVRLFRFFDFSVEQGKQYRYRVVVGVKNPNFGIEGRYLKNPASATKSFVLSTPSDPTAVVVIPFSNQIFAGPIDKANKSGDPSGTVMVTDLNEEGGYEAVGTREVTRGTSVVIRDAQYLDPATRTLQTTKTLINTGAVVIDVDGGEQLPAAGKEKLLEPVSVLILNRQGLLEAHNELDDALSYQSKDLKKMAETPRARQREEESSSDEDSGGLFKNKASANANTKPQPKRRTRGESSND